MTRELPSSIEEASASLPIVDADTSGRSAISKTRIAITCGFLTTAAALAIFIGCAGQDAKASGYNQLLLPKVSSASEQASAPVQENPTIPTATAIPTATEIPATATPTEVATATPEPTSTPEPTPIREVKPMPPIIDKESLEQAGRGMVIKSSEWIEEARTEATQRGENKIPLAQTIYDAGGRTQRGTDSLIYTDIPQETDVVLPAHIKGKVIKAGQSNNVANIVRILGADGRKFRITFSLNGSTLLVKQGDDVDPDTAICTTHYNESYAKSFSTLRNLSNIIAVFGMSNANDSLIATSQNNILTDDEGNVVIVKSPSDSTSRPS